jgi:hypothetical protein
MINDDGWETIRPTGVKGFDNWHVMVMDGPARHVTGLLQFTDAGGSLIWADDGAGSLVLGLARGKGGSIVAKVGECEN